jgi:Fe-S-cluster containining protein
MINFAEQTKQQCPFLGDDNLCTIYDQRPEACAQFPTRYSPPDMLGACPLMLRKAAPEQVEEARKQGRIKTI